MKLNPFKVILFFATVFFLSSCSWFESDKELSSDASFSALVFAKNDTIPGLNAAKFTLVDDSIITNVDSLPYNTDISHVIATFRFTSSNGAVIQQIKKDGSGLEKISLPTLTDTLDFNRVISITNFPASGVLKDSMKYIIKVNIHKVEPDKYEWIKLNDEIYNHNGSAQKAIYFNDSLFLYVNTGIKNYLYTSIDGVAWSAKSVTGLPSLSPVRNIYQFNNKLYIFQNENSIYTSNNGHDWIKLDYSAENYELVNYLFQLNGEAWSIVKSKADNVYRFAHSQDGATWLTGGEIPNNFPLGDFASASFTSRTNKTKAIVAGGYNQAGMLLNKVWSTENGSYWVDFSLENLTFGSLAGASMINYANKLLLFGGKDANGTPSENNILESIDEGFSWSVPDSADNYLHQVNIAKRVINTGSTAYDTTYIKYPARSYQSVVYVKKPTASGVYSNHFIYLIGGKSNTEVYSDVWRGKLNRLSFIEN